MTQDQVDQIVNAVKEQGELTRKFMLEQLVQAAVAAEWTAILIREYHNGSDFDRNNLIYGTDFIISDAPSLLSSINGNILQQFPDIVQMTRVEYTETIPEETNPLTLYNEIHI